MCCVEINFVLKGGMEKTKDSFPLKYFCVESNIMGGTVKEFLQLNYISEVGCKLLEELPSLKDPPMVDHRVDHVSQFVPVSEAIGV